MKRMLSLLLKFSITLGIFVGIFLEFGGGYVMVPACSLDSRECDHDGERM